jgi:hypothetical protein
MLLSIKFLHSKNKQTNKKTQHKKGDGGMIQGLGPEFKPQHHKKKKKSTLVWGCGSVVQSLSSTHEDLSSISSTTKKKVLA